MQQIIGNPALVIGLFALLLASAQAQPAFLRKDIQVPGQYGSLEIQVRFGSVAVGDRSPNPN